MRKLIELLALLCVAAPVLTFGATGGESGQTNTAAPALDLTGSPGSDPILAKGKGVEIRRSQLDTEVINIKAAYAARGIAAPADLDPQVLDGLVFRKLVLNRATEADQAEGKKKFEEMVANIKTNNDLTDEAFDKKLNQQLLLSGQTREQWEKQQIEQATIPIVLKRELKISISDEDAKKYYEDHPGDFEQPEEVDGADIFLSTKDPTDLNPNRLLRRDLPDDQKEAKKAKLEGILKRARAGEDFAALAKEYSEDATTKDKGGEFKLARGTAGPEIDAAAFSLKTNQVSDIITTPIGYHVIKLYEKIPATKVDFATVEARIKDFLVTQAIAKQIPDYRKQVEKEAAVEIMDPSLKLPDVPASDTSTNASVDAQAADK